MTYQDVQDTIDAVESNRRRIRNLRDALLGLPPDEREKVKEKVRGLTDAVEEWLKELHGAV
jgi:hypothetical protein